jgi:hypothetical protein
MKWICSIVSAGVGGRPVLDAGAWSDTSLTGVVYGASRSICPWNSRLRDFFVVRFRPGLNSFVATLIE